MPNNMAMPVDFLPAFARLPSAQQRGEALALFFETAGASEIEGGFHDTATLPRVVSDTVL